MAQTRTTDQAMAYENESGCSLTCDCWDCHSYRRHLLKLSVAVLLACGLGGELGWQRGWWRADASTAAPVAEVELAKAPVALGELF